MSDARNPTRRPSARPLAVKSLNAVSSTNYGTAFSFDEALCKFGLQVTCTSGSTAKACKVNLMGALSTAAGFTAITGGAWSSTAGQASGDIVFISNTPLLHVRADLVSHSTAVGPVSAWISAGL